ncbi:hypothetical protein MLDJOKPK_00187 [Salmonella phage SPAsTU]|nr:hypothetical protein MLDJOKPK_00187 [Salmonella phage SPAsTU]
MFASSPKELGLLLGGKVTCHPNVNPETGLRWDGTIAPPDEIGITISFPKPMPKPKPLEGLAALYHRKK